MADLDSLDISEVPPHSLSHRCLHTLSHTLSDTHSHKHTHTCSICRAKVPPRPIDGQRFLAPLMVKDACAVAPALISQRCLPAVSGPGMGPVVPRAASQYCRNPHSYLRLIDSCITQLKAHGPSRTCNESKDEEEEEADLDSLDVSEVPPPTLSHRCLHTLSLTLSLTHTLSLSLSHTCSICRAKVPPPH